MPDPNECSICYENTDKKGIVKTQCNHIYCVDCFIKHLRRSSECAYCRKKLTDEEPIKKKETVEDDILTPPGIITGGLFNFSNSSLSVIRPPITSAFSRPMPIHNPSNYTHFPSTPIMSEELDSMFNDLSDQIFANIIENSPPITIPQEQEMERGETTENTQEDTRAISREFTEWIINTFTLR